MNHPDTSEY